MTYTKVGPWVNGSAPALSAANLDHLETQYDEVLAILTARGDLPYRGATTWERLAKGTAGQFLQQGTNDPLWATGGLLKSGMVIFFDGSLEDIPSGFVICDGNNETRNWLDRFPLSIPNTTTEPGTTGGSTSKTTAGHKHTVTTNSEMLGVGGAGYGFAVSGAHNTSTVTDTIADIRPKFITTIPIMKT